jgi:hypothetical protein
VIGVSTQAIAPSSQVAAWHASLGGHERGVPAQTPSWHVAFGMQNVPWSHAPSSFVGTATQAPFTQAPTLHASSSDAHPAVEHTGCPPAPPAPLVLPVAPPAPVDTAIRPLRAPQAIGEPIASASPRATPTALAGVHAAVGPRVLVIREA